MKLGLKTYIDVEIGELRTKEGATNLIKTWEETAKYVKEEIEKIIKTLEE